MIAPLVLATVSIVGQAAPAYAACAPDADAMRLREMIDAGATGEPRFPALVLGVVVERRDLGGDPHGGDTLARLAVVEHPVGFTSSLIWVRYWKAPPGVGMAENLELRVDGRFALLVRRLDDGTFDSDGYCGESRRLNHDRFRELVRYARSH